MAVAFTDLDGAARARENLARMREREKKQPEFVSSILRPELREGKPMVLKIEDLPQETLERAGLDDPEHVAGLPSGTVVELKPRAAAAKQTEVRTDTQTNTQTKELPSAETTKKEFKPSAEWIAAREKDKAAILADRAGMTTREFLQKQHISSAGWTFLRKYWNLAAMLPGSGSRKNAGRELTTEEKRAIALEAVQRGTMVVARERGLDGRTVNNWVRAFTRKPKTRSASQNIKNRSSVLQKAENVSRNTERHVVVHVYQLADGFPKFTDCRSDGERVEWLRCYRDIALAAPGKVEVPA